MMLFLSIVNFSYYSNIRNRLVVTVTNILPHLAEIGANCLGRTEAYYKHNELTILHPKRHLGTDCTSDYKLVIVIN